MSRLHLWVPLWSARLIQVAKSYAQGSSMWKCAVVKVPFFIFFFLSCYNHYVQQRYLANGLSKLTVILARNWSLSSTTYRRLHSFKFILVNKSHPQHSVATVRRTPFSNVVHMCTRSLIPRPKTIIIGLGTRLVHKQNRKLIQYGPLRKY